MLARRRVMSEIRRTGVLPFVTQSPARSTPSWAAEITDSTRPRASSAARLKMFSTLMFIGHLLGCCAASLLHCTISHVSGVVKRRRSLKQGLLRVFFGSANYLKYLGIIPL